MSQLILNDNTLGEFEHYYMNNMQLLANIIDPNMLFAEVARAGGKTEGVTGPRLIRVANDMPGELSFLVHKTYVALITTNYKHQIVMSSVSTTSPQAADTRTASMLTPCMVSGITR